MKKLYSWQASSLFLASNLNSRKFMILYADILGTFNLAVGIRQFGNEELKPKSTRDSKKVV